MRYPGVLRGASNDDKHDEKKTEKQVIFFHDLFILYKYKEKYMMLDFLVINFHANYTKTSC